MKLKPNERIDELAKAVYKILDKLEQRIATLEKVLQSHAKCIGELREDKKDDLSFNIISWIVFSGW